VDYHELIKRADVSPETLAAAVTSLLDKEAIRNLVAIYSLARDDDDLEALIPLYAPEGSFAIGGAVHAGHEALRTFYTANMTKYRTSLHSTHTALIEVFGDSAIGLVTGHAELAYQQTLMLAAYRYDDRYVRVGGRWLFASRVLRFMYTVPADQMATSFRDERRIRWPDTQPAAAEIPESYPSFATFQATRQRPRQQQNGG
jgi:uncharacterized protein (TIGR02246 family)